MHRGQPRREETLLQALSLLNEGQTLGRYELLCPIGRGGMAIVWAARLRGSRGFSKLVAIKTMLPTLSSDPRFEQMFLAEAELASRIHHPNVCEIHDLGEQDGLLYLVMERIDGDALAAVEAACEERATRMPYAAAVSVVAQAARGLQAAHELTGEGGHAAGVVHRDVSPQNILLRADGLVKIVDFGVAKAALRTDHVTQSGFIKGKVAYLAPEQADGSPTIDARADIFALGSVLYELTTGTHPFRRATDVATLLRTSSSEPAVAPKSVAHDYPPELSRVVMRALEKDPAERHASMAELARELEAIAADLAPDPVAVTRAFTAQLLAERREHRATTLRESVAAADLRAQRSAAEPAATTEEPPRPRYATRIAVALAAVAALGIVAALSFRPTGAVTDPPPRASGARATAEPSPTTGHPSTAESGAASAATAATPPTLREPGTPLPPSTATSPSHPPQRATPASSGPRPATAAATSSPAPASPPPPASSEARFRDPGF